MKYWADPGQKQEGKINHHFGGRGVYFQDPSGHLLEIITALRRLARVGNGVPAFAGKTRQRGGASPVACAARYSS